MRGGKGQMRREEGKGGRGERLKLTGGEKKEEEQRDDGRSEEAVRRGADIIPPSICSKLTALLVTASLQSSSPFTAVKDHVRVREGFAGIFEAWATLSTRAMPLDFYAGAHVNRLEQPHCEFLEFQFGACFLCVRHAFFSKNRQGK